MYIIFIYRGTFDKSRNLNKSDIFRKSDLARALLNSDKNYIPLQSPS